MTSGSDFRLTDPTRPLNPPFKQHDLTPHT